MQETDKNIACLEKLLISEDLEELTNCTSNFNIFNALKLQNNEIRHSNFLGWLMAPYETHKLGDYFLKEFLKSALQSYSLDKATEISLSELAFFNLDDADVKREYKNIDLLVVSRQNNFVCIIENKIWTGEHDCQLERYADIVNNEFKDFKKMFIYLSPINDDNCELMTRNFDDKNVVVYIPMNYKQVFDVLKKVLKFKKENMKYEVKTFIEHYTDMLERNIMGESDKKVIELCRKIYREHKNAIDLIVEHSDERAEIFEILQEVLNERTDINIIDSGTSNITFLPKALNNTNELQFAKDNSFITKAQIISFGPWKKDKMYIELTLGEAIDGQICKEKRASLKEHIVKSYNLKKFNGNDRWAYTPAETIIDINDYNNCENKDEVKNLISNRLNALAQKYINKYAEVLNSWQ